MQNENENQNYEFPKVPEGKPSFEPGPSKSEAFDSVKSFIWETIKIVIISLIIIVPVRYYVIQPFYVQGASMEPNFFDHEYLIIDEISYRINSPERGDIIVFRYPKSPSDFFIKRVIGLPGEKVEVKENQVIIYNEQNPGGFVLDESGYLADDVHIPGDLETTLNENEYFVMGDNRQSSLDSRSFGPITSDAIIGRTWLRGWPFDRFKVFERPDY